MLFSVPEDSEDPVRSKQAPARAAHMRYRSIYIVPSLRSGLHWAFLLLLLLDLGDGHACSFPGFRLAQSKLLR